MTTHTAADGMAGAMPDRHRCEEFCLPFIDLKRDVSELREADARVEATIAQHRQDYQQHFTTLYAKIDKIVWWIIGALMAFITLLAGFGFGVLSALNSLHLKGAP